MTQKTKPSGIEWIGNIPAEWGVKKLKHLCNLKTGSTPANNEGINYDEIGYNWYTPSDFNFSLMMRKAEKRIADYIVRRDKIKLFRESYVLVVGIGATVGKVGYGDKIAYCNQQITAMIPRNIDGKYLFYFMFSQSDYIKDNALYTTLPIINNSYLENIFCLLPPPKEQQAIAAFLDTQCAGIDGIVAEMEQQVEILKQYKTSLITETVTKGLDKDASMKDSGIKWIGKMPAHWEVKKMKYCLATPLQYGANETGDEFDEREPRYIRITDITLDNKLKEDDKLSLPMKIAKPYLLNNGDILFARSGATVGKTFYFDSKYGPAAFAGYMIRAAMNKSLVLPEYVYYTTLGNSYQNWLNLVYSQATIQNVGANKYENLLIACPPLEEQKQILSFLDKKCKATDDIIAEKRQSIETMKAYKKSLIYEYVTGKKRVVGDT